MAQNISIIGGILAILVILVRLTVVLNRAIEGTERNSKNIEELFEGERKLNRRIEEVDREGKKVSAQIAVSLARIETDLEYIKKAVANG